MLREIGFTTTTSRVFKGNATVIPVGKPKKQSGRFRLNKRARSPRAENMSNAENLHAEGEGFSGNHEIDDGAEEGILSAQPSHDMIVLGMGESSKPTIFLRSPLLASSSSSSEDRVWTLARYNSWLFGNRGTLGVKTATHEEDESSFSTACEGRSTGGSSNTTTSTSIILGEIAAAHLSEARRSAVRELDLSLAMTRLREAMEIAVGYSLLNVCEAASEMLTKKDNEKGTCDAEDNDKAVVRPFSKYVPNSLADRAEVQGVLPALIFESLSLIGPQNTSNESSGADSSLPSSSFSPLLPPVPTGAYPTMPLNTDNDLKAFNDGLPWAFIKGSTRKQLIKGELKAEQEQEPAARGAEVEIEVEVPYSPSLQQRLFKSVHDIFRADTIRELEKSRTSKEEKAQSNKKTTALKREKVRPVSQFYALASRRFAMIREQELDNKSDIAVAAGKKDPDVATVDDLELAKASTWASRLLSAQLLRVASIYRSFFANFCSPLQTKESSEAQEDRHVEASALVEVVIDIPNAEVTLDFGRRRHRITLANYRKLRALFSNALQSHLKNEEDNKINFASHPTGAKEAEALFERVFHFRVFTMLERYFALSGCQPQLSNEGGWHAAVPSDVMRAFAAHQGVAMEAFASPLNTASFYFGSAFVDTDCFFGSVGSFFSLELVSGSAEVNPPFDLTVALQTIAHVNSLCGHVTRGGEAGSGDKSLLASSSSSALSSLVFSVTIPTTDSTKTSKKSDTTNKEKVLNEAEEGGDNASPKDDSRACDGTDHQEKKEHANKEKADKTEPKPLQSAHAFVSAVAESPYLLAQRHLAGSDAPYRDGNEFVAEGTHFLTRMGTLVATLGAPATDEVKSCHEKALAEIADVWKSL